MNAEIRQINEKHITDKFLPECKFYGIFLLIRIKNCFFISKGIFFHKKYSLNFKFMFVAFYKTT